MDRRFHENFNTTKFLKDPPGVYRYSRLGSALRDTLDDLKGEGKIGPFLEQFVLKTFDMKITEAFARVVAKQKNIPMEFQAQKVTQSNFIDGSWEIHLENVLLDPMTQPKWVNKLVLVADNFADRSVEQRKIIQALSKNSKK